MTNTIDFMSIALYRVQVISSAHSEKEDMYKETLFGAIYQDNSLLVSNSPHILNQGTRCILVHAYRKLAWTCTYSHYVLDYIDEHGVVYSGSSCFLHDGRYVFTMRDNEYNVSPAINLTWRKSEILASFNLWGGLGPIDAIQKCWDLYLKVKDIENLEEAKLITQYYMENHSLAKQLEGMDALRLKCKLLEVELEEYHKILDAIKAIVKQEETKPTNLGFSGI